VAVVNPWNIVLARVLANRADGLLWLWRSPQKCRPRGDFVLTLTGIMV
jgi:hypothetical protein